MRGTGRCVGAQRALCSCCYGLPTRAGLHCPAARLPASCPAATPPGPPAMPLPLPLSPPRHHACLPSTNASPSAPPLLPPPPQVHVAGIRHRRQLLSLRVHGEPNRLVLSTFEAPPDSAAAAERLVGARAARDFGLLTAARGRGGGGPPPPPPALLQAARRLRTEALKQLLNMFGVGQGECVATGVCLYHCQRAEQGRCGAGGCL